MFRVRALAYALFVAGVAGFAMLPANRYGWMQQFDPALKQLPLDPNAGIRRAVSVGLLLLVVAAQAWLARRARSGAERSLACALAAVAAAVWWLNCY